MTITFKCGHALRLKREVKDAPACPECGERVVKNVSGAAPRFSGACEGPHVQKGPLS